MNKHKKKNKLQLTNCGSIFIAPNTRQPFFTLTLCLIGLTGLYSSGGIYFTTSLSTIY